MQSISCGIDFGTSNSSIAVAQGHTVRLIPVENEAVTIPSAIFYPAHHFTPLYGRAAMQAFFERKEGRLLRSLKRVLGTSLMKQGTMLNGRPIRFEKIIGSFLRNLKEKAEDQLGQSLEHVVMGRPVHFVDNDPAADTQAEAQLRVIAEQIGFKHIAFQFEPIAAAFAHEAKLSGEKLALVADLGGGTSDFTVIRLSHQYMGKTNRASDILANTGVRVGGNDFDKDLSMAAIMPELGFKSVYGDKRLEVPLKPYYDLSEWSKVNFLYTTKLLVQTRQLLHQSHDKQRLGRLLKVLEQETGHSVLAAVEEAKIALTTTETYPTPFGFIEDSFAIAIQREAFEDSIQQEVAKIVSSASQCVNDAGIQPQAIELVILTGGSTEVPLIQQAFRKLFPAAAFSDENKLSSVGLGLAYASQKTFNHAVDL